ncbi:MAG: glycosyltransferase family 2 protein [Dehalococcoidales bacterium]
MYKNNKIGVVVAAYNEEMLIAETLKGMPLEADRIYVIDDASTDATRQMVESYVNGRVCLQSHAYNQGVGATITTGYKKALEEGMDIVVVMAGDNQMDGKYLPQLLAPILSGKADYTKGNRLSRLIHRGGMSNWRFFGNWLLTLLTKVASGYWHIRDSQNGYTAITRECLSRIDLDKLYPRYGYCNDILVKLNVISCRVSDVPMPARYGTERSKIRYRKYILKVSWLLLKSFLWRLKQNILRGLWHNRDFTLGKYTKLCQKILSSGYHVTTVASYLNNVNVTHKTIILRHDVDRKLRNAIQMAELEHRLGLTSTYYFRMTKSCFQPEIIRAIAELGHEIGYHYEALDKAKGNNEKAIKIFESELNKLRQVAEVKTICMHGNPLTKWDNRDLWSKYNFTSYGLLGEAYLSLNNVVYLSDTGRTWGAKYKVKDWLPSAAHDNSKNVGILAVTSTDSLIELIKSDVIGPVYILVHPERWSDNLIGWITDLVADTGVNLAKRILELRK